MKNYIFGYNSREAALEVKDYPYGRLRTSIFYWIETKPKQGDRFCSYTIDPKSGRKNATKAGTYSNIAVMYVEDVTGYIRFQTVGIYSKRDDINAFIDAVGFDNLNAEQQKQARQLRGEIIKPKDKILGDDLRDFSVKWEYRNNSEPTEVKITFDRPDGVKLKEIFEAIKSLNQDKVKQLFEEKESRITGTYRGFVRVCVRSGVMLTTVDKDTYYEWLAQSVEV